MVPATEFSTKGLMRIAVRNHHSSERLGENRKNIDRLLFTLHSKRN